MRNQFLVEWNNDSLGPPGKGLLLEVIAPGTAVVLCDNRWLTAIPVQCCKATHHWDELLHQWIAYG